MTEKKRNATERDIAKVEEQLQELAESEHCGADYQKLQEIADRQAELETQLEQRINSGRNCPCCWRKSK